MDSRVVGLIICNDVLLETNDPLHLSDGLNVVYGLNGAGKSRLLRALQNAFLGIEGDTTIALVIRADWRQSPAADLDYPAMLRAEEQAKAETEAYGRTPMEAVAAALASPRDYHFEDREFPTPVDERIPTAVRELIERWTRSRVGEDSPLARELLDDNLFMFAPTGSDIAPSWDVWPVADTRGPAAATEIARLEELAQRHWNMVGDEPDYFAAVGEHEDAVIASPLFSALFNELWSVGVNRHLLAPSPFMPYAIDEHSAPNIEPLRVTGRIDFGLELLDDSREPDVVTREHVGAFHAYLLKALIDGDEELSLATFRSAGFRLLSPRIRRRLVEDAEPQPDWSDLLQSATDEADEGSEWDPTAAEAVVSEIAADLERRVNSILQSVLLDAPAATLHIESAVMRYLRPPVAWKFGPGRLRLQDLSRAEGLWATRAINEAIHSQARELALGESASRTVLAIVDEPEAALHRAAEAHMASTLRRRAADGMTLVAATHSPELLDAPEGRVLEVKRGGGSYGRSLVQELDLADKAALAALGLMPSDLLRWPRVILLVEGEHDEALLDAFLGERLRAARVRMLPLHGGSKLPGTIDSQVLFDHTDAHVVALLDNLRASRLRRVWDHAADLAVSGELAAAKDVVVSGLPDDRKRKGDEAGYMRTWLTKAIDAGLASRVSPYGLEEADIIRYLPVQRLIPGAASWRSLDDQHQTELREARPDKRPPRDFKKWLGMRWKVEVGTDVIREIASETAVPKDFLRLMKTLEALSSEVR